MITRKVISLEDFKLSLREAFGKDAERYDKVLYSQGFAGIWDDAEKIYNRVINMMEMYIPKDSDSRNIEVRFGGFFDTGSYQLIAEGAVSDLGRPVTNSYNWHLQNTSQWLFAFGLVFDKERLEFSIHT
jgi:hypothetical protein